MTTATQIEGPHYSSISPRHHLPSSPTSQRPEMHSTNLKILLPLLSPVSGVYISATKTGVSSPHLIGLFHMVTAYPGLKRQHAAWTSSLVDGLTPWSLTPSEPYTWQVDDPSGNHGLLIIPSRSAPVIAVSAAIGPPNALPPWYPQRNSRASWSWP
jgi:hypothetical protein